MSNYTINNLGDLGASVVAGDYVPVWDVSAATTKKTTLTNIFAGVMATANTFTNTQTFSPTSTGANGASFNMPAGTTGVAFRAAYNGVVVMRYQCDATIKGLYLDSYDNGASFGHFLSLGHNNNGSTPAAGFVKFTRRTGTTDNVWSDNTGVLRTWSGSNPTNANDTSGTVVGTQTSNIEHKNILGDSISWEDSLAYIVEAAKNRMAQFEYKSGSYNYSKFDGLILNGHTDERYGMDNNNSLNTVNAIGDLMKSVALLSAKIEELNARISELESK